MTSQTGNKQLQYKYCPIPKEVKAIIMKFGLSIEQNMINIFLEKSYAR